MAKKRYNFMRKAKRKTRSIGRRATRHARGYGIGTNKPIQMDAMLYGAVRQKIENFVSPMVNKLPFGAANEEVAMGTALWLGAKFLPGMLKDVAHKGLTIENYRIGEIVGSKFLNSSSSNSMNVNVLG